VFEDIDAQAASLRRWNQRYEQLSCGRFSGEVCQLELDGVGLFIEDLHQSVHQTGCLEDDVLAFGVPLLSDSEVRFSGQRGTGGELHVFSGREGFEFHSPKRHVMLGIEVQRSVFEAHCGDALDCLHKVTAQSQLLRVDGPALRSLRRFALGLFKVQAAGANSAQAGVVQNQSRDALLDQLALALSAPSEGAPWDSDNVVQLERRVRALVMSRLDDPPTVAELCQALGVSRRTLQSCFQATWGMPPLVWLNTMRLNAVRRRLKTADSVTEASTDFGFWHFGHFSNKYQSLFGELPSVTLGKNKKPRC
jgi:AraC family ethanolamine operon transcriptional activator